jgi:hypothetical protein
MSDAIMMGDAGTGCWCDEGDGTFSWLGDPGVITGWHKVPTTGRDEMGRDWKNVIAENNGQRIATGRYWIEWYVGSGEFTLRFDFRTYEKDGNPVFKTCECVIGVFKSTQSARKAAMAHHAGIADAPICPDSVHPHPGLG